ncbi:hypothetical protein HanRHA438_Chr06g0251991 [Helianthus annuus]|nr:hypothetical protein HanRHA438_Chr06g0251991 [Helianthus annuus]
MIQRLFSPVSRFSPSFSRSFLRFHQFTTFHFSNHRRVKIRVTRIRSRQRDTTGFQTRRLNHTRDKREHPVFVTTTRSRRSFLLVTIIMITLSSNELRVPGEQSFIIRTLVTLAKTQNLAEFRLIIRRINVSAPIKRSEFREIQLSAPKRSLIRVIIPIIRVFNLRLF